MKSTVSVFEWRQVIERVLHLRRIAVCMAALPLAVGAQQTTARTESVTTSATQASGATATLTRPGQSEVSESYRIQPTDVLVIDVVNERELAAKEFRVASNGEISYPYIGTVKAVGRTAVEIQNEIKERLEADYLVSAQVLVHVRDFRKRLVSVFGQVNRGGLIEIPPERRMTVVEAITAAGGLSPKARESDIQINRKGQTLRYHMRDLRRMENPVYVEPDDVIFVPESRI